MNAKTEQQRGWLCVLPLEGRSVLFLDCARVRFDTTCTRLDADGWLVE
jgi:hypothetical protein